MQEMNRRDLLAQGGKFIVLSAAAAAGLEALASGEHPSAQDGSQRGRAPQAAAPRAADGGSGMTSEPRRRDGTQRGLRPQPKCRIGR